MTDTPSPNHGPRPTGTAVDMLVLHYTGMQTAAAALDRLRDPASQVSAHYLVFEDGAVHRLVPEDRRAWHAGVSQWRGETNINSRSIGIELANPGHQWGYTRFPEAQMAALTVLARDILTRHPIPPRNVVGHSDIAPDRKLDPGEKLDWARLAADGIGVWPAGTGRAAGGASDMLAAYGYDVAARHAVAAFQRHFRPALIDGAFDDETAALLATLLRQVG